MGVLKRIQRYVETDDCLMVTYGDGVSDVDIQELLKFHQSHGKIATVTTFRPVSRFGILDINEANQVMNFIEKPKSDAWASAGYFVFRRRRSSTTWTATNVFSNGSRWNVLRRKAS